MGLFSRWGRSSPNEKFKAVTLPLIVPQPPMDPRNARYTDIFYNGKSGKTWSHMYGPYTAEDCYALVRQEPFTRTIIKKIRDETIRRGQEWKEKYAAYCPSCKKEFPVMPDAEQSNPESGEPTEDTGEKIFLCDDCGTELEIPDPKEYEDAQKIIERPIRNNPHFSFEDLLYMRWGDILILGNGYVIADLEYSQVNQDTDRLKKGDIVDVPDAKFEVKGLFYAPERMVKKVMNDFGQPGGRYWACLDCRKNPDYMPKEQPGNCDCGKKLFDVHLIVSPSLTDTGHNTRYYFEGEYHWTPFEPDSTLYCYPPVATLGNTIETLIFQNVDMLRMYKDRRTPNQVKWVRVQSQDSFDQWLDHQRTRWKEGDETWLAVDSDVTGQPVGVEKTTFSPTEMGTLEYLDALQNTVAIAYGVMPSERGSPESATGLGNQSKEITISVRNVLSYQDRDNEEFFQWYKALFGIQHWNLVHVPPDLEDKAKEAERIKAWLEASKSGLELGLQPRRRKGSETFEVFFEGDFDSPEDYHDKQNFMGDVNPFGGTGEFGETDDGEGVQQDVGGPGGEGAPDKEKAWQYAKSPSDVPSGAQTKRGKYGALYFDPETGGGEKKPTVEGGDKKPDEGGENNDNVLFTFENGDKIINEGTAEDPFFVGVKANGDKIKMNQDMIKKEFAEKLRDNGTNKKEKNVPQPGSLTVDDLKEGMIVGINSGGGMFDFVEVTSIDDDTIYYNDHNQNQREVDKEDVKEIRSLPDKPKEKLNLVLSEGGKSIKLYRSADSNYLGEGVCFADDKRTAMTYMVNSGFGGSNLYEVDVKIKEDEIFDVSKNDKELREIVTQTQDIGDEDPVHYAIDTTGRPWPYCAWEELKGVKEELVKRGYKMINYNDDYPEGANVYTVIGKGGK